MLVRSRYALLRYDSPAEIPSHDLLGQGGYAEKVDFQNSDRSRSWPVSFMSNSTTLYRCVAATAKTDDSDSLVPTTALLLLPVASSTAAAHQQIPLSSWQLAGSDYGVRVSCQGAPSLVHVDLHKAGQIADPFDSTEIDDEDNRWVMTESNWTYTARFDCGSSEEAAAPPPLLLVAQGLDTLATIRLNGVVVGHSANMHLRVAVPLRPAQGANTLSFSFENPIPYAAEQQRLHPCGCSADTCEDSKHHTKPCKCCNFNATQ